MIRTDHRTTRGDAWSVLVAFLAFAIAALAHAAPPTPAELAKLCTDAEDQAHCGRLIEARQLRKLDRIVERNGDELRVSLTPFGLTVFRDTVTVSGARTFAVWDYMEDVDTLVLFATKGDRTEFWLVQRRGGGEFRIPSEPVLAPDRKRFATADFCAQECDNEVAVWRIGADGVRKELAWTPRDPWTEASVTWKGSETLALEFTRAGASAPQTLERRLDDAAWLRVR